MDTTELNSYRRDYQKVLQYYDEAEVITRWAARTLEVFPGATVYHQVLYSNLTQFAVEKKIPLCKSVELLRCLTAISDREGSGFYQALGTGNKRTWFNLVVREKRLEGKLTEAQLEPWRDGLR